MLEIKKQKWISFSIYYDEQNSLLINALPLILSNRKEIIKYMFSRSNERGSNLILMFEVKNSIDIDVFTKEINCKNKDVLKLYDNMSYEFLFFEFYNKKARIKREKGIYSLKHQKLVLKNKNRSQPKEHSTRFLIKDQGLFARTRFGFIGNKENPIYNSNKDAK